jgi:glycosyltransferase involved in cell wall biosynthesis
MKSKRIIAVHLLNDWSGSPLVFRQALEALQQTGDAIILFTATPAGRGFLSDLAGVHTQPIRYAWSPSKLMTLINYLRVQAGLFVKLLFFLKSSDYVYVNTLLPFGAALAAWVRGCQVIYHVHEVSVKPRLLKAWLRSIANRTATQVLFVSDYTLQQTALRKPRCRLIYNALPPSFSRQASQISAPNTLAPFTALMLCSNKAYKGVDSFVTVARQLPRSQFVLVLNASAADVATFVSQTAPPSNCTVYPAQSDTVPFYQQAHVVLNLSHPDGWIETFGMTVLEAMACGRPVIIPPVGGIRELIEEGQQGFMVDARRPDDVVQALLNLSSDIERYTRLAEAARQRSAYFGADAFQRAVIDVFRDATSAAVSMYGVENLSKIGN